jgi:ribosomal protein L11 methyltransferase
LTSVDWLEVRVQGPSDEAQAAHVEVTLQSHGFAGWIDESTPDGFSYLFYVPQEPGWQERLLQLERAGLQCQPGNQVRDEDWAENWKKFYHPLVVGSRLVICPSWEDFQPDAQQLVVTLDPGSAFGTGYHWSTRLCLEFLEVVLAENSAVDVLDMGTGSGILAIAAHKLGVRSIVAVDNDPVAVKVARENLALNGVSAAVELADKPPARSFGLVTANLIASLLIEMASDLYGALEPTGRLICGGIIKEREAETVDGLTRVGLRLLDVKRQEEWVSLLLQRP